MGQEFKNHYESTKFQAEVWVREMLDRVPTTILRPAIVVGDSRTGETEKFDGPYYILRALSRAQRMGRPMPQFGRSGAAFNVVPVDYVVAAMVAAAGDEATLGQTLHLVDPDPLTAREVVELLSRAYAGRPPQGADPGRPGRALAADQARPRACSRGSRRSRSPTSTTRSSTTPAAPSTCWRRTGWCRRSFRDYANAMVDFFRAHEDEPALRPKPPGG